MEPELTPGGIEALVQQQEDDTDLLRQRMEADYDSYRLTPYQYKDAEGSTEGYRSYTANEPRVFAERVISWLAGAPVNIRFPVDKMQKDRQMDDQAELFLVGALSAADQYLADMILPGVQQQLATFVPLRGWCAGRVLLRKTVEGETQVEIMPWDPLHTYFGRGRGRLSWACYAMDRTPDEVEAEYGSLPAKTTRGTASIRLLNYWDNQQEMVVADGEWLKEPTPHGCPRIPVFIVPVGTAPPIRSRNGQDLTYEADFGESIFAANRALYENFNLFMSIMMTLVARSGKPPLGIPSKGGTKTLEKDPYKEGTWLSHEPGEAPKALELLTMQADTPALLGRIAGELQRGSLPYSVFGELAFQLSGFAINSLRSGVDAILKPRLLAMETAYRQICRLLLEQFATGRFRPIMLQGYSRSNDWFERPFQPSEIGVARIPEVRIVPVLPQDEAGKVAMAQMLREGKQGPILPLREILSNILGVQNVDAILDALKEEKAETLSPIAALWTMIQALQNMGRNDLVEIYKADLKKLVLAMLQVPGGAPPGGPGAVPQAGLEQPPTLPPQVLPNAEMGVPPPEPVPQGPLPLVPPGQPRPGA